jgi:hypothetical protein
MPLHLKHCKEMHISQTAFYSSPSNISHSTDDRCFTFDQLALLARVQALFWMCILWGEDGERWTERWKGAIKNE